MEIAIKCQPCDGTGKIDYPEGVDNCGYCKGKGYTFIAAGDFCYMLSIMRNE